MRILIGVVSVVVRGNELRFRTEGDCFLVSFWFFFCFFCFFCKYAFGYCYYLYYLIKCSCMSKVSSLYTVRVICGFAVVSFNLSTNGE